MKVRPYILAGGRSSRMGTDKAMLRLGNRTLLGRTVDKLRALPSLQNVKGQVTVTIVGERPELEGADRLIADRFPACGPLGGMEAALSDLCDSVSQTRENDCVEWAFFLPVDMPFLPASLVDALLQEWFAVGDRDTRACYLLVDGKAQPLVSMMHKALHPFMLEALTAGQFKVTPVLQSAARVLASHYADSIGYSHSVLHTTFASSTESVPAAAGWKATVEDDYLKRLWFSNLNSEEDFREAETFVSLLGSS